MLMVGVKRKQKPKKCPETGRSLTGKDRDAYALNVWGVQPLGIGRLSPEAQERYIKVIGYDPREIEEND